MRSATRRAQGRRPMGFLAAAGLLALLAGAPAVAEEPPAAKEAAAANESWAYGLWSDLMSPFCPGRTLADCTSSQAEQLRSWILVQAAAGRSREDVEAELVQRYGETILGAPRARGIGLTAYLLPALAFAAGGSLVAFFLVRQTRRARQLPQASAAVSAAAGSDQDVERLVDAELEQRGLR